MAKPKPIDMLNQGNGLQSAQAPDIYGALIGWRAFEIQPTKNKGQRLKSPHYTDHIWKKGEQPASVCKEAPCQGEECMCGYNAFTNQDLMDHSRDHTSCPVIGEVEMWGAVRVFDLGYRAENVKVKRLIVREMQAIRKGLNPNRLARELEVIYQVPVSVDRRLITNDGPLTVAGRSLTLWEIAVVWILVALAAYVLMSTLG